MRCRDVSRAILAPDDQAPTAEVEAHLAACPRCARLALGALRLDRIWEATRPVAPGPAAWDAAWARIDRELSAPEPGRVAAPIPARPAVGRRAIRAAVGVALAAAAALLVALNLPGPADGPAVSDVDAQAEAIASGFEVPVGHTVLYHVDTGERQVIQVIEPPADDSLTFFDRHEAGMDDIDYYALFNLVEALPELMASAANPSNPFGPLSQ